MIEGEPETLEMAASDGSVGRPIGLGVRALASRSALNVAAAILAGVYAIWLTAFLVGSLGPGAYGTWATVTAVLAPLLVLDAGLGLLVVRASASRAVGRVEAEAEATTAHGLYTGLGTVGILLGIVLGFLPGPLLGLSGEEAQQTRLTAWILALDFGLIIATSAFPALLRGRQRYGALLGSSTIQVGLGVALSIALVPSLGLVGAAIAQLLSHAVGRLIQLVMVSVLVPWFPLAPRRPRWSYLRPVLRFSGPLIVISIASQISFSTDVIVVGAIAGATAASWIAIGARFPMLAVALLSVATDVLFPAFVEEERLRPQQSPALLARSLAAAGFMGGCAFLFLASARNEILDLWVPGADPVASTVFAVYCATWAIHVPAHVLALLIVAHDRHSVMAPIVLVESLANLLLSIAFVLALGPVGAAVGSFIAVGLSNAVVLPVVVKWQLGVGVARVLAFSAAGLVVGAVVAAAGWVLVSVAGLVGLERLVVQGAVTGVAGLAGLALVLTGRRPLRRLPAAGASG